MTWETGRVLGGEEFVDGLVRHWGGWAPDSRWRPSVWVPACFVRAHETNDAEAVRDLRDLGLDWPWARELLGLEFAMASIQLDRLLEGRLSLIRKETQLRRVVPELAERCDSTAIVTNEIAGVNGLTVRKAYDAYEQGQPAMGVIVGDWNDVLYLLESTCPSERDA